MHVSGKSVLIMRKVTLMVKEQNARGREIMDSAQIGHFIYRATKANKACMNAIRSNYLCNQRKGRQINDI